MKLMRLFPVVLTVFLLIVGCQTAPPPEAPPPAAPTVAEIQQVADAYVAALEAGDAAAIASRFTEDGILMANEGAEAVGREAIQAYYSKTFEGVTQKGSVKVVETGGFGDWGFARGTGEFTATPKAGGKAVSVAVKWMNISKRQPDGSWRIYRHIYNLNHPNPVPPPR